MKTDTLKKSLLDYAIKGSLTAKFRRENAGLNAFDEISTYNDNIKQKRKDLEKKLKICEKELKLEKDKDKKAPFKSQIQSLKKEIAKCKEITPLFCQESRFFANAQNDKKACHTDSTCHTDLERSEREVSNNTESQLVILSECEKSNTESKRDFSFATQTQNAVSLENDNPHTPPFEIPNSWAWVKLGDICEIRLGKTPPRDTKIYWNSNDYQWVSIADMGESKILTQTKEHISQAGREKCFGDFIFKKGTLLLSFKLTIGKVAFLGFDGFHNEGIASVLPLLHAENEQIFKEFLFHFLPPLTQLCESTGAIKGETLNKQKLNNLSIPLPPLKEQQEIVKKLDLLVTLANDFAITKENLKRIEKRIEKSLLKLALEGSLSKLYRRSSPTLSAFDEINTYNEAIKEKRKNLEKELKKCEKELKLEKDKDKKALFKSQIQMLKKELTKCKEITPLFCHTEPLGEVSNNTESTTSIIAKRKGVYPLPAPLNPEKNKAAAFSFRQSRGEPRLSASSTQAETGHYCPPFSAFAHHEAGESEAPFTIPSTWAWVKLGDIGEWKAGSTPSRAKPDFYVDGEILWLKTGDLNDDVVYHTEEKITKEAFNSYSMSFSDVGDILVAMYGATIGKTGIVGARMTTNQACCACKTNATIHNKYLFYFIQGRRDFIISQSFGTGQPNISKEKILNFLIPLPPLCEQEYIVQTLDTLFTLKKGLRTE